MKNNSNLINFGYACVNMNLAYPKNKNDKKKNSEVKRVN